jgi:hypothetical protein
MARFYWLSSIILILSLAAAGMAVLDQGSLSLPIMVSSALAACLALILLVGGGSGKAGRHAAGAGAPSRPAGGTGHTLMEATLLLPFARAILQAVPPRTEDAAMILISQCQALRDGIAQAKSPDSGQLTPAVTRHLLELDEELQKLLESLQFQDITRQMIEGALAILDDLGADLARLRLALGEQGQNYDTEYRLHQETLRRKLIERSLTKDEKKAITGVTS